jgi:hemerythrin
VSEEESGNPVRGAVAGEHRQLAGLFAETRTALAEKDGGRRARAALSRLQDGVEAHFQREESLYFPTIWALRPDLKDFLAGLVETHPRFRELLDAITRALEAASFAEAARYLEELVDLFSDHERAEELLLHSLEAELTATT